MKFNNLKNKNLSYKIVILLLVNMLFFQVIPVKAQTPNKTNKINKTNKTKKINVNARSAIAMDAKTKRVLYEKNANEIVPMASTTKIMTTLVALNYGNLSEKITISKKAASIRGSRAGYKTGEEISIEELLYGLMLRSGNDAAIAIAEGMAGSVEKFCNLMNEYASSIGALNSHFESPHGLDSENHYTTPYDLALITAKAKEIDKFNEIVSCKEIRPENKGFSRGYNNINKILWQIPEANGVKTGYTGKAGKCLVSSVNIDGNDIIIVVLNSPGRWEETKKIYNFVKDNYEFKNIAHKKEIIDTVEVSQKEKLNLISQDEIVLPLKKGEKFSKNIEIKKDLYGLDIDKGNKLGELVLKSEDGNIIYKQQLISDRKIKNSKNKLFKFKKYSKKNK